MDWFTDAEVKEAVEALPEQFRMAVLLADVEGFSYKEIAEILDIPIGTVMSRLHRGRKALQKRLYEFADAPGPRRRQSRRLDGRRRSPSAVTGSDEHETAMTDCERSLHELYDFLDGELTDERRTRIEPHLDELHALPRGLRLRGRAAPGVAQRLPGAGARRRSRQPHRSTPCGVRSAAAADTSAPSARRGADRARCSPYTR